MIYVITLQRTRIEALTVNVEAEDETEARNVAYRIEADETQNWVEHERAATILAITAIG